MAKASKRPAWHERDRASKLANTAWPHLADAETQREMSAILKAEGRRPLQVQKLLSHAQRGAMSPLGGAAVVRKR